MSEVVQRLLAVCGCSGRLLPRRSTRSSPALSSLANTNTNTNTKTNANTDKIQNTNMLTPKNINLFLSSFVHQRKPTPFPFIYTEVKNILKILLAHIFFCKVSSKSTFSFCVRERGTMYICIDRSVSGANKRAVCNKKRMHIWPFVGQVYVQKYKFPLNQHFFCVRERGTISNV